MTAREDLVVRPVADEELQAVAELTIDLYREVLGDLLSDEYRAELADVARRAREALVLVAVDDGELLGSVTYVSGLGNYAQFEASDEAGVRMLVVARHAQRRGVGTALVQACIDKARDDSRQALILHTTPAMSGAQRLYEKLGFRRLPERDWIPEEGIQLLSYGLDL